MRRAFRLKAVLSLLLTAVLLAVPPVASAQRPQIILATHWASGGHYDRLRAYIDEYNAMQTDVEIVHQIMPDIRLETSEQLLLMASVGEAPDIVHVSTNAARHYVRLGIVTPPPPDVASLFEASLLPGAVGLATIGGAFLGPPTENMVNGLVLNPRIFAELGLEPKGPETWADLDEMARRLRLFSAEGALVRTGLLFVDSVNGFIGPAASFGWSNGAEFLDESGRTVTLNTREWEETFLFLRDMFANGAAAFETTHGLAFDREQAGMFYAIGPWYRSVYIGSRGEEWYGQLASAPLPRSEKGDPVAAHYGYVLAVTNSSKLPDEAWEFLLWLTTQEREEGGTRMGGVMASLGSIPVTRADMDVQPIVREPFFRGFVESFNGQYLRPLTDVPPIDFSVEMFNRLKPALLGETSISSALQQLQDVMQGRWDEYLMQN